MATIREVFRVGSGEPTLSLCPAVSKGPLNQTGRKPPQTSFDVGQVISWEEHRVHQAYPRSQITPATLSLKARISTIKFPT